jgi:CRISPR-associated protein Csd2
MNTRRLIVFKHETPLGNAPAHKLFDLVKVERGEDEAIPARSFLNYDISLDHENLPENVEIEEKI